MLNTSIRLLSGNTSESPYKISKLSSELSRVVHITRMVGPHKTDASKVQVNMTNLLDTTRDGELLGEMTSEWT